MNKIKRYGTRLALGTLALAANILAIMPAIAQNASANAQGNEQGEFRMFPDVPPNHWAYQAVADLKRRGILLGYPADNRAGEPKVTAVKPKVATKSSIRAASRKTIRKAAVRKV